MTIEEIDNIVKDSNYLLIDTIYRDKTHIEAMVPRERGNLALTEKSLYMYDDGCGWVKIYNMDEVAFEVVDRLYVTGRGHVTVINNKDLIPIEIDDMVVEDDEFIKIHGIEKIMTLMTHPQAKPNWGILTNEPTHGDTIFIKIKNYEQIKSLIQ